MGVLGWWVSCVELPAVSCELCTVGLLLGFYSLPFVAESDWLLSSWYPQDSAGVVTLLQQKGR